MYIPDIIPSKLSETELRNYLTRELERISSEFFDTEHTSITLEIISVLPTRPQEGLVMNFAAGVATPTAGLHEYIGGTWVKL